ncbi:MAG TPA: hypothetical protein VKB78_00630 [Pirellulales bacterium]|nr:hypothetical protein [Pirellulales bacterium]
MKRLELEVLSDASNAAVVRMPGRHFPGVVVQGDTLSNIAANVKDSPEEALAVLHSLLAHYINVLDHEGLPLPFSRPAIKP